MVWIIRIFKFIKEFLMNTKCILGTISLILIIAGIGNPVVWAIGLAALVLLLGVSEIILLNLPVNEQNNNK